MQFKFEMTDPAAADFAALDSVVKRRIAVKMRFFATQQNPLRFAERLHGVLFGQYRFRVGDYRILFDLDRKGVITILVILRIRHRREAY